MITYLCGGINGLTDSQCRDWREIAKEQLKTDTLDPMRRDYRGKEDESVSDIVRGDLDDIQVSSDCLLVNAEKPSWGTAMEIVYAHQIGLPIVAFVLPESRISPWLRYHCSEVFLSLNAAINYINAL